MHVVFDPNGRPFILDSEMRWEAETNAFLAHLSLINGNTRSARTWRSYAFQFADWLKFCARIGVDWRQVTEVEIATYRNILVSEPSLSTARPLKPSTVNYKLTVLMQFYRFAAKKGWIARLPFEIDDFRVYCRDGGVLMTRAHTKGEKNVLRLVAQREELEIPPRRDVRRFIGSFRSWRDQLIAETMWVTGMRNAEVCALPLAALPDTPHTIEKNAVPIRITGKGQKQRSVLFPTRLLCSIDRYVCLQRERPTTAAGRPETVFIGRGKKPLQPSAIDRVFSTNCKRTGLHIWPHLLRHCYAVERLAYLQDIGAPNPLKVVQMELGHAHLATTERYLHITERMRTTVIELHNSFIDRLMEG